MLILLSYVFSPLTRFREKWVSCQLRRVLKKAIRLSFYKNLYTAIDITQVSLFNLSSMIPMIDKHNVFGTSEVSPVHLAPEGRLSLARSVLSSSGTSGGAISYGLTGPKETKNNVKRIDEALDRFFNIKQKSTLIINSMPLGVSIESKKCTVISTGTRYDLAVKYLMKFSEAYDQTVLIGEVPYMKRLVECAAKENYRWQNHIVHVVVGSDYLSENLRTFLCKRMEWDPDDSSEPRTFLSTCGMSEIGLNLFSETRETVMLRRYLMKHSGAICELTGMDIPTAPLLMYHHPARLIVETCNQELIITTLDPDMMKPMIRYNTHDFGALIPYDTLKTFLDRHDLKTWVTEMPLDLTAFYGRRAHLNVGRVNIYVPQVQEILYGFEETIPSFTGAFRMEVSNEVLHISLQLNPDYEKSKSNDQIILGSLSTNLQIPVQLKTYLYREYPFMDMNIYESKFRYLH